MSRYWDGRVRRVVSVRRVRLNGSADGQRIETLECGHEYAPSFPNGHPPLSNEQYRVCDECEPKPDAVELARLRQAAPEVADLGGEP